MNFDLVQRRLRQMITVLGFSAFAWAMPLSTAYANMGEVKPAENQADPDFVAGKAAIESRNWKSAITQLQKVVQREPGNADAHNLLGFAYRHDNNMELSFKHYNEALRIDPNHKGAHEYIGQAYLKTGKLDKAKEHLKQLEGICGKNCDEYRDLAKAIGAHKHAKH